MQKKDTDETKSLEEKLDRLIKKGVEMSEALPIHERNRQIERVIDDCISQAIGNLKKTLGPNISENELIKREKRLRTFVKDYYERKLSRGH